MTVAPKFYFASSVKIPLVFVSWMNSHKRNTSCLFILWRPAFDLINFRKLYHVLVKLRQWTCTTLTRATTDSAAWTTQLHWLLPHTCYTWAAGHSWAPAMRVSTGIISRSLAGGGVSLLRPRWLWHLFNTDPSVFTLPDKKPVCRPRPLRPLACTDSALTHSLTGLALMSNGCQKTLLPPTPDSVFFSGWRAFILRRYWVIAQSRRGDNRLTITAYCRGKEERMQD